MDSVLTELVIHGWIDREMIGVEVDRGPIVSYLVGGERDVCDEAFYGERTAAHAIIDIPVLPAGMTLGGRWGAIGEDTGAGNFGVTLAVHDLLAFPGVVGGFIT